MKKGVVPKARSGFGQTRKEAGVWIRNRERKFSSSCICTGKQRNCEQSPSKCNSAQHKSHTDLLSGADRSADDAVNIARPENTATLSTNKNG
jgi:hypothetical protein